MRALDFFFKNITLGNAEKRMHEIQNEIEKFKDLNIPFLGSEDYVHFIHCEDLKSYTITYRYKFFQEPDTKIYSLEKFLKKDYSKWVNQVFPEEIESILHDNSIDLFISKVNEYASDINNLDEPLQNIFKSLIENYKSLLIKYYPEEFNSKMFKVLEDFEADCGGLPDFGQLAADINNWFAYFGYEGTANQGGNNGACKAEFSPLWIEQTNVIFNAATFWEPEGTNSVIINQDTITWQGGGTQYLSFIQTNCTDTIIGPSLKIINACDGATYLWSTNATSQVIPYQSGVTYSVTVTCPDGCSEVFTYGGSAGSFITNETITETEKVKKEQSRKHQPNKQFKVYPNPAIERLNIEYGVDQNGSVELVFYTNTGMLAMRNVMISKQGMNTKTIDVSNLHSGIYFIQLIEGGISQGFQKVAIIK